MTAKISPTKVGITAGDPNGIGLEAVLKVFRDPRMFEIATPVVYATLDLLEQVLEIIGEHHGMEILVAADGSHAKPRNLNLVAIQDEPYMPQWGEVSAEAGQFAIKSLEAAVADLASTKVDVLVTSPIHKDAMRNSGFAFPGHTEYLQKVANADEVLMLLCAGDLRIGVATGHIALKEVSDALSTALIRKKILLMRDSLSRDFGCPSPRIAVLGLNPHASDNGLMGDEEKKIILPVIRELASEGIHVMGPYAADGFFGSGAFKAFDGVLAMYHDQGLAPFKALSFGAGVNFTAGLPIVRTSPDHGTGFDIAGKGKAHADSTRAAIYMARDIRIHRREHREYAANPLEIKTKHRRDDDRRR